MHKQLAEHSSEYRMCHKHNAMKRHYFGPTLGRRADTRCQAAGGKALLRYTQRFWCLVGARTNATQELNPKERGGRGRGFYGAGL